jgi:uncharacterized membrane protein (UPF0127 family)
LRVELETGEGIIAVNVRRAKGFFGRLRGLMYSKELPEGDALLIEPCDSIHTFGMRFPIDVLFLDAKGVIIKALHSLKPGKVIRPVRGGCAVLEMNAGSLPPEVDLEGKAVKFST